MENPLKNDIESSPEKEICDPEPREAQAIQGSFTKQENGIYRVHSYQQLSKHSN
jgi:hypothetical protein